MWEKFNKIKAQVIAVMIIIICSFGLAYYGVFFGIPESSQVLVNKVTDIALVAAVAWLFNASRQEPVDKIKKQSDV